MHTRLSLTIVAVLTLGSSIACNQPNNAGPGIEVAKQADVLMPQSIGIVEGFTGFRRFDHDQLLDGIELMLKPEDSFGDPVKIAGDLRVELYTFIPAAGIQRGERVCDPWSIPLAERNDQLRYWNRLTQMYEIKLYLPNDRNLGKKKYVLLVTYTTSTGKHLTDECVLEVPIAEKLVGAGS